MLEFDIPDLTLILGLVISIVLPLIVGLITKVTTSASVKAIWLAGLAAVNGVLVEWLAAANAGEVFGIGTALVLALGSFLVAVGLHFGIYKPTGASAAVQKVGS
jgi:hypothetical protein